MKELSKINYKLRRIWHNLEGLLCDTGMPLSSDLRILHDIKDLHKGKLAYLIGNGPSVNLTELEHLKPGVTFCFNRFYLAYPNTNFRPDYLVLSDRQTIDDFGQEAVTSAESEVFVVSKKKPKFRGEFGWIFHNSANLFEKSLYHGVTPGGGSIVVALQLAVHMGIREFVLYGVDHHYPVVQRTENTDIFYSAIGEGNHFIDNYRSGKPWCPPQVDLIESSLIRCSNYINSLQGGRIINATNGGKLELFPRHSINEYLK
jgi:hypothetical protein